MTRRFTFHTQALRIVLCGGLMAGALALAAGCSDIVTYSEKSRNEGLVYYNHGQYTDAAGSFRNAVNQEPRDYISRYYLGQSLAKSGSWDKATQQYLAGLDVMQTNYAGLHDREYRLKIIDGLGESLAHTPGSVNIPIIPISDRDTAQSDQHLLAAKFARYSGDADTAINEYTQATSLNSKDASLYKDYGYYLLSVAQKDRARDAFTRAYVLDPTDEQVTAELRRMGVIPGPSLKYQSEMVKAPLPEGPIPEIRVVTERPAKIQAVPRGGSVSTIEPSPLPFETPWNSGTSSAPTPSNKANPRD